ncbi:MAG: lipoate--protein ligase family protein [Candidatus Bathyarchaeota archaeon]|nr:lipoate--protein ligase family protein [Candidatus Bathyarchaeota archaeon]
MSESWRFLDMRVADAYTNMAVDEALSYARGEGEAPNTLRFYRWNPSAVTLGYFQSVEDEVDLEACKKFGIDVNRRISGGGAVLNSSYGEITYSVVAPDDDLRISTDVTESYRYLCHGIVEGLALLGIEARFKPINDIIVGGRKISGNAQIRRYGAVLHHGTILVDFDAREMFSVLKISEEKISDKMIEQAEERVTTIRRELGRDASFGEVRDAMEEGFAKALGVELAPGELSDYEQELVKKFREKYVSREWIFRR